jgi:uncharacterized protein (DUF849 family)
MARPVIITCALTGGADSTKLSPHVPVTPEQIANEGIAAAKAGAAIVHIHVREPSTGKGSMETKYYREVVQRIRENGVEVLINLTSGPGASFTPSPEDPKRATPGSTMSQPERRVEHILELKPDICSLDVATMNFGEYVFMNIPAHLKKMAELINSAGVKPEIEVFDVGQVRLANELIEKGFLKSPSLFQLCLGIPWGAPATTEAMLLMKNMLPKDAVWASFGISRAEFHMAAQAVILGGHVRVGLEDNLYLERGKLAPGNAPLVERAVEIIQSLGETPATPAEARKLLSLAH